MRQLFLQRGGAALMLGVIAAFATAQASDFPPTPNTQKPGENPPRADDSLKLVKVPQGFKATLFAAEPDVQQPIAMTVDDRGRLWVVENYTWDGHGFDKGVRDRVVILEDADHDGRFDKRTVFFDRGRNLSAITHGFGGVFLLAAPQMIFIPDRNGDDVPDGEPEVLLDGFAVAGVGHNIVNGLTFGPDGWIYGRHGIQATSMVGKPGSGDSQRVRLNCSIWRYHPVRRSFEVVTHGTTNPWGFDYDDHGEMWFTNNVIGHLWHIIPGAHYKRMYGESFNPRIYELIDQHADHYHWDTTGKWTESREGSGTADKLGGGHSHCGGLIYLGDNFPEQYRNVMFTCNTHGKRVNNDALVRRGGGYVGEHRPDFFFANNSWFRGTEIKTAADGGIYISDWSDYGECHDHDGIHRTSGRVFKVVYGDPQKPAITDVSKLSDQQLVELQLHRNDHFVRAARRVLMERAAAGRDMTAVQAALREIFEKNSDVTRKLRAMWALYVINALPETWLTQQLGHADEHVRSWAVRLLVDRGEISESGAKALASAAESEKSTLVQLYLVSSAQRLPLEQRKAVVAAMARETRPDATHRLMLWYAAEPAVTSDPHWGVKLARTSAEPLLTRFIARRLTEDLEKTPGPLNDLLAFAAAATPETQLEIVTGMADALRGWRKASPPEQWRSFAEKAGNSANPNVSQAVRDLSVVFGDGRALDSLIAIVKDSEADGEARKAALKVLIDAKAPNLLPMLKNLAKDRVVQGMAIRGLAQYDDPETPRIIIPNLARYTPETRVEAINTLVSRPKWSEALLNAVQREQVDRSMISAFQARQIRAFNDDKLTALLSSTWGEIRGTAGEKQQLITRYKALVTPEAIKSADLARGQHIYQSICAACHKLNGQGGAIGPDLTGSNRDNVDYLLENIVDPSAVVAADFRMTILTLKDGRVVSGVVPAQNDRTVTLQTPTEKLTLDRNDIANQQVVPVSMMPEGLLQTMTEQQIRDLFAYLMNK